MNERIQGVYVYGGGPVQHYVFRGQQQRERKQLIAKLVFAALLVVVFAWCMRSAFLAIAEPPQAIADPAPAAQVQAQASAQQPGRV